VWNWEKSTWSDDRTRVDAKPESSKDKVKEESPRECIVEDLEEKKNGSWKREDEWKLI